MTKKQFKNSEILPILQEQKGLKERYEKNLKNKDPLSKINIAQLCYGDKIIQQHLMKNN